MARRKRHVQGKPKRLRILKKSKAMRRWLLCNPWVRPMCVFNYAAVKIQQHLRGFLLRKRKKGGLKPAPSKGPQRKKISNKQLDKYLMFLDKCKSHGKRKPIWLDEGYSSWCCVRIQATWKMHKIRKRAIFGKKLINQVATIIIQTAWRNRLYRNRLALAALAANQPVLLDVFVAAEIIQLCWRAHCNKRIYKYFRDLVVKKLKGAPYDLLKSIIPNEAHVLDRASGVHVRFRLGGRIFPPKVYFKIYTHRPLCDVNSFAPRNYVSERPADPNQIQNRSETITQKSKNHPAIRVGARYFGTVVSTTSAAGTADWYKRDECNNWRPIASHMFENIITPPWFKEASHANRPKPFHFIKLRRTEARNGGSSQENRAESKYAYIDARANNYAHTNYGSQMQPCQRQGQAEAKSDDSFSYADAKDGIQTRDLQQQQRMSAAADFKRSFSESESESGYKSTSTVSLSIPRRSAVVLNKNSNYNQQ